MSVNVQNSPSPPAGLELVFLGTGTSAGIPMIGCDWPDCACRSQDPRDRRDRTSALIRYPDPGFSIDGKAAAFNPAQAGVRQFLIDPGPEMRQQAIRHRLSRLDGVIYTHAHADHIFGTDDLRRFNGVMGAPIDIYAEPSVTDTLRRMFGYIFEPARNINKSFVATLIPHPLEPGEPIQLWGATWTPLRLMHGRLPILGFRIDHAGRSIAYCTDVSTIPPETYPLLQNLDMLVIDALRYRHHPTHMSIDQALEVIDRTGPAAAYFTHLAHEVVHAELTPKLPAHVHPAHDGLSVRLPPPPEADTPEVKPPQV